MEVDFSKICRDYLALRGESPDLLPLLEEGEESAVLTLARELEARLLQTAIEATLELPTDLNETVKSLSTYLKVGSGASAQIHLPDDYLKFHSLRLADWKEPLYALEPEDSLRRELGSNAPSWMFCSCHPMVTEHRDAEGLCLKIYGSKALEQKAELLYAPRPRYADGVLYIATAAYGLMLKKLLSAAG